MLIAAFERLSRTYERILHAAGEGIFSLDLDGSITFVNPAATALLGWPMEELLGRPAWEVVRDGGAHAGQADPLRPPFVTEHSHRRGVFRNRAGEALVVEYSLALIREEDAPIGAVLVFSDVTRRVRAEQALQRSLRTERETNERLTATRNQLLQAEKMAAIGQLAAGVAHEINTPLGYVQCNLSVMQEYLQGLLALADAHEAHGAAPADPQLSLAVDAARRQCDLELLREDAPGLMRDTRSGLSRVAEIVRGLLDFARPDGQACWQWAALDAILDAAMADAQASHPTVVRVARDYAAVPPILCLADPLRQAVANVLLNALQAVPAETGAVTLRLVCAGPEQMAVEVEDNGCGIAPEHLRRVFDPFFTTRPVGGGTGMGLSVADAVIRRHGGRIELDSTPGRGTRVRITLPERPAGMGAPRP